LPFVASADKQRFYACHLILLPSSQNIRKDNKDEKKFSLHNKQSCPISTGIGPNKIWGTLWPSSQISPSSDPLEKTIGECTALTGSKNSVAWQNTPFRLQTPKRYGGIHHITTLSLGHSDLLHLKLLCNLKLLGLKI
jgi:hypothetical protein